MQDTPTNSEQTCAAAAQAVLELPAEDEYGFRPTVSQAVLERFINETGLPRHVDPDSSLQLPSVISDMRAHSRQDRLCMYSVMGGDLPGLVPPSLASYPFWFFVVPEDIRPDIQELIDEGAVGCYGDLTGDPWENAVYLEVATPAQLQSRAAEAATHLPSLSFRESPATNIWLASQLGCIFVVYDCAGSLHLTAYAVGDDDIAGLQGCAGSSFQKPGRYYSFRVLQERTRAVEETGHDPEGAPSGGNHVFVVYHISENPKREDEPPEPSIVSGRKPGVHWGGIDTAIGRLRCIMDWLPPGFQCDDHAVWIKSVVTHEFGDALLRSPPSVKVEQFRLGDLTECYVLVARAGTQVAVVAMDAADARFQEAYNSWAQTGSCSLALENIRNGRLGATVTVAWPPTFRGSPSGNLKASATPARTRRNMNSDAAIREHIQKIAAAEGIDLECYGGDAVDEEQWKVDAQD